MLSYEGPVFANGHSGLEQNESRSQQSLLTGKSVCHDPLQRMQNKRSDLSYTDIAAGHEHSERCTAKTIADEVIEHSVAAHELGLVRIDGSLVGFLAPGAQALCWGNSQPVHVERLELRNRASLPPSLVRELLYVGKELSHTISALFLLGEVPEEHVGLLHVDGRIVCALQPGLYGFVRSHRHLAVEICHWRTWITKRRGDELRAHDNVTYRAGDGFVEPSPQSG